MVSVSAIPSDDPRAPTPEPTRAPLQSKWKPYWYIAPVIVSAVLFTIVPFLYTFYISFTNWGLFNFIEFDRVGLDNYRYLFQQSGEFLPVLRFTILFMVLTTLINVGFGLFLALMLNHPGIPERNLYRTLLIIPWALPFILLIQVWTGIFNNQGPINELLMSVGLDSQTWIPQLGDSLLPRSALFFVNLWFTYPFFMTVGLAALQSIPRDLYEVADLDGAGTWARFKDITVPFLVSATVPLLITQAAFQINNAGIIILFTAGLPAGAPGASWGKTDTLASYAYDVVFILRDYGLGAAYGVVTFVMIAVLIIVSSITTRSFAEVD
ncbi:MAG: sugar ABC transporter permease [Thermomicrobiales bacterium]